MRGLQSGQGQVPAKHVLLSLSQMSRLKKGVRLQDRAKDKDKERLSFPLPTCPVGNDDHGMVSGGS